MRSNLRSILFPVILTFVVAIFSIPTLLSLASKVETKFYPVVSEIVVTRLVQEDKSIVVHGRIFRSKRQCDLIGVEFFQSGNGPNSILLPSERVVPIRKPAEPGINKFGPWRVYTSKDNFRSNVFIKAFHRCHPFYPTESVIYTRKSLTNE